jgi:deoxyribonuclease IV
VTRKKRRKQKQVNMSVSSTPKCKVGWHIPKEDMVGICQQLLSCGFKAVQVYLSGRIAHAPGEPLSKNAVEKLLKLRDEQDLYIAVHGKLTLNFCQEAVNIPALTCDIFEAARINADVVLHQGENVKKLSREEALTRYALNVVEALDQTAGLSNRILLENSCQQGTQLGYKLDDLVTIWRLIGATPLSKEYENIDNSEGFTISNYQERIGFCLDLCHCHVGGMIDMRDPDAVTRWMKEFDDAIGLQNLRLIHFNDSEIKFDGHNDSHCDILRGYIGNPDIGGNSLGFRKVIEYANTYGIPVVLETQGIIPMELQASLLLGWVNGVDIEQEYLMQTAETRADFAKDPRSRKGRKKKAAPSPLPTVLSPTPSNASSKASSPLPTALPPALSPASQVLSVGGAVAQKIPRKPLKIIPIPRK